MGDYNEDNLSHLTPTFPDQNSTNLPNQNSTSPDPPNQNFTSPDSLTPAAEIEKAKPAIPLWRKRKVRGLGSVPFLMCMCDNKDSEASCVD
ncbi:hypothetical protein DCAR_0207632 [Daucus carota subsp. sativus]|uniref:Uncharacterized protein n=1 Tax=Daucus carota subsp. sativus TaxID=79200 RepID=A0A166E101_DAUCS|nr:hypothetical protein DCAR_0207632 [Daucus carota subsp. sativus]